MIFTQARVEHTLLTIFVWRAPRGSNISLVSDNLARLCVIILGGGGINGVGIHDIAILL